MDTKNNQDMYRYRLLASVVMEAAAPLAAGSGQKSIMTDATVARDANGLPYIPGTSIAGVIRHAMKKHADMDKCMGFQRATDGKGDKEDKGQGSLLAVTEAMTLKLSSGSPYWLFLSVHTQLLASSSTDARIGRSAFLNSFAGSA